MMNLGANNEITRATDIVIIESFKNIYSIIITKL